MQTRSGRVVAGSSVAPGVRRSELSQEGPVVVKPQAKKTAAGGGARAFGNQLQNGVVVKSAKPERERSEAKALAEAGGAAVVEEVDLSDVVGEGLCDMSLDESGETAAPVVRLSVSQPVRSAAVEDIDELDDEDPQCVTEYVNDIYRFLRAKEKRCALDAQYLKKAQNDLNGGMRAILLDWLADVGLKFKLLNDTTHMTVMVIDRFLAARHNVPRKQLQLVGVAAMLVASKYEEIYAPEVRDFEYICDGAFSRQEILNMEVTILNTLSFDICHPTPIHFLRRFSKAARSESECHTLAKYLTELAAVQYDSLRYAPSLLAASAVFLSRLMFVQPSDDARFTWNATMIHYTGYSRADIQPCVASLAQWARDIQNPAAKLNAVFRKYSKKFFGVALLPVPDNGAIEAQL